MLLRILTIAALVIAASSQALAQLDNKCVLVSCTECNCYWSSECGTGESCDYSSGCTHVGKKDGTCSSSGAGGGLTPDLAALTLGLWLDAYQDPTRDKGLPNAGIVRKVQAIGLSKDQERRVRFAAFNTLDVVLGFDFGHPQGNCELYDARCLGILRTPLDSEAKQLLQAVRSGLVQMIQKRDRAALQRSLNAFWKKYPRFRPHHTGRCYPHGHPEYRFKSISECQMDELTRIVDGLVQYSGPKAARL